MLGSIVIEVGCKGQKKSLPLLVVAGKDPSLFGRDWLMELRVDWCELYRVHQSVSLQDIFSNHAPMFKEELGEAKGVTAKLHVSNTVKPCFCRARTVPHALKIKVEQALQQLIDEKVIESITMSDWAAPIVPVLKPDGSVTICGDYKVTINKAANQVHITTSRGLIRNISRGKSLKKLNLAHAYTQIPLDEASKQYVTINTHKGLFRCNRLPFGVSATPSIFQRTMEGLLHRIPHVSIYLDDILVTGASDEEHLTTLDKVRSRLEEAGLIFKCNKCAFMLPSVEYLSHKISAEGLEPIGKKVRAGNKAPLPNNVSQL